MGKGNGQGSKSRSKGASAVTEPPTLSGLAAGSTVAADAPRELATHAVPSGTYYLSGDYPAMPGEMVGKSALVLRALDARQRQREIILNELLSDECTDTRAKALAAAGKVLNDYERAELRREEDALDVRVASELNKIERTRAQKRSGVVREDEAPQLPLAESQRTR